MFFLQPHCKFLLTLSLVLINVFSLILAIDAHYVQKRQVGVLARAGALPQGKRSVEVLARNGELPHIGGKKEVDKEDLIIAELDGTENLSKLRAHALADKTLEEEEEDDEGAEPLGNEKRSVAALARNGELPQKRLSIALTRSGYLIRPPPEVVRSPSDLLDPDDFLADGQPTMVPEFLDERGFRTFLSTSKRSLGSARNFLLDSGINSYNKKNLASLARDGGFTNLRNPSVKQRRMDDNYELADWHDDDKKNVGKREVSKKCREEFQTIEIDDKINNNRRKRGQFTSYPDYGENFSEGTILEKRFLGRIPQLGRIHQKSQTPSSRRRSHLRPNWL